MSRHKNRQLIEVADVRPGIANKISLSLAMDYCRRGLAYYLKDGRLKFRHHIVLNPRRGSDVYVDRRAGQDGAIWWNGADTRRGAMHKPFENVQIVKPYVAAMKAGC